MPSGVRMRRTVGMDARTQQCLSGEVVRHARRAKRLSQAELGKLTNLSAAQVSRYERGISPLNDVTLLRLFARALDIQPQALGLSPDQGPPCSIGPRHPAPPCPLRWGRSRQGRTACGDVGSSRQRPPRHSRLPPVSSPRTVPSSAN
ncbi:helix-turn-helix domain-containing protein [Streptomyces sp. DW26H14]|uniref:helix-turn-helix domain-containing protein n=1 Tax=Streptomyces sp. DW26H14 TaxID=3435395 RepID=UPI00403D81FA